MVWGCWDRYPLSPHPTQACDDHDTYQSAILHWGLRGFRQVPTTGNANPLNENCKTQFRYPLWWILATATSCYAIAKRTSVSQIVVVIRNIEMNLKISWPCLGMATRRIRGVGPGFSQNGSPGKVSGMIQLDDLVNWDSGMLWISWMIWLVESLFVEYFWLRSM